MSPTSATLTNIATSMPVAFLSAAVSPRQDPRPLDYSPNRTLEQTTTSAAPQADHQSPSQQAYLPGSVRGATWNDLSWRRDAACVSVPTETFFPVGLTGQADSQTQLAKRVCASCPVRDCCLEFALRTNQDHGVWGGRTEEERRTIRRSRRAAARKAAARAS
jgi:WhiB family transcriptional regulator, redox-sensing transcriptional regulator